MANNDMGVVDIGRNEGQRLVRCLSSVLGCAAAVVYVDSNSTDGSAPRAQEMGAQVVQLDLSLPFTAARARNAGLARLRETAASVRYVMFVDGDCEVEPEWLPTARAFLDAHGEIAAVCGRRKERFPTASVYNRLCDIEWNTPVGEALAYGGDVLMRMEAVVAAGGYRDSLIAGEEPELCVRLRAAGWKIWRLDAPMTLHDAAMVRFSQWWRRNVRAGHAYAEGAALHGAPPERHWVRHTRSVVLWGLVLPLVFLLGAVVSVWMLAAGVALYLLQWVRLSVKFRHDGGFAIIRAGFMLLGKFAEAKGVCQYAFNRSRNRASALIEYK